jgi:diaminopimelate decarboxylase
MTTKTFPLSLDEVRRLAERFPTPFHLYDEAAMVANIRRLKAAFAWNPGFREYFAVKATPNPYLLKLFAREGLGCDCSSLAELVLAERAGVMGESIMFTSNDTPEEEFRKAKDLGAVVNLDDLSHIDFLERRCGGLPELVCCRYNPGKAKEGNTIIGIPEEAKYGFTRAQIFEGFRALRDKGVRRFGLHTMVASNELQAAYFAETARLLFELAAELRATLGITVEFVNIGGGIGIPYRPEQDAVDLGSVSRQIRAEYDKAVAAGLPPPRLYMECGRMITGPYGWLVSRVLHLKHTYRDYVGLDACMANLMRPAIYGAYHHITVLGKEDAPCDAVYDVTGSLCENNDKFAIQRALPTVEPGDYVVIHDTGAHGHAMGFNYNGRLRSAELLLRPDRSVVPIRRAETLDDLFATLDFGGLATF